VKRVIGFVTAIAVASCFATPAAADNTAPPAKKPVKSVSVAPSSQRDAQRMAALKLLAPADEYFGPLKMSILGIRNTIKDLGLRYDVNHDLGKTMVSSVALTEAAIRDWEHKYPRDRDVPRAMYFLQRLYAHVLDDQAHLKAQMVAKWLFADYPTSEQARVLHRDLAAEAAAPVPTAAPAAQPAPPVPLASPAPAANPAGTTH